MNTVTRRLVQMLVVGGALAGLVVPLSACGGGSSAKASAAEAKIQREADLYEIGLIERRWHDAETHQNISEMMSTWAPDATFQIDVGQTVTGAKAIRSFWLKDVFPTDRKQHWISDTATWKVRETVEGDRGTLYFECHEIDARTRKVVAVVGQQATVAKIGGRWLITNSVGASPVLGP
jgi:ketosteroid isomerase-like protein